LRISHTDSLVALTFSYPLRVLSSASYGGGLRRAKGAVNIRTNAEQTRSCLPEQIIRDVIRREDLPASSVGLLTSAPMDSARFVLLEREGMKILTAVTAGTSNALNITISSDTPYTGGPILTAGTINIIIVSSACLLDDCMASSVISATEAKTAALMDLGIKCTRSGSQATGTGTDTVTVFSGNGPVVQYAGGHTVYGQLIAAGVYRAVKGSLSKTGEYRSPEGAGSSFDF